MRAPVSRSGRTPSRDDAGLSLVELLIASAIAAIVIAGALAWLYTSQRTSGDLGDTRSGEADLQLMLDTVVSAVAGARPTALCLNPHPTPSVTTPSDTRVLPVTDTSGSDRCTEVGEHWGYTPLEGPSGTKDVFQPGGPFKEASGEGICYYTLHDSTKPAVTTSTSTTTTPVNPTVDDPLIHIDAPYGACIDIDSGQLRIRTLTSSATTYLAAARAASYDWSSGTWTEYLLGAVDEIGIVYYDSTRTAILANSSCSAPFSGTTCVATADLSKIELVEITLKRGSGTGEASKRTLVPVRVHRELLPNAPLSFNASLTTSGTTADLDAGWEKPLPNGSAQVTGYHLQWITGTATWSSPTGEDNGLTLTSTRKTGLANAQHEVRVAAINSAGTGPWTAPITVTP